MREIFEFRHFGSSISEQKRLRNSGWRLVAPNFGIFWKLDIWGLRAYHSFFGTFWNFFFMIKNINGKYMFHIPSIKIKKSFLN